jgi:hypothetical protein
MKTLITAAIVATLSTPAMAEKTPVKPVSTCGEDITAQIVVYHLDQVEMLLEEMRANILQAYPDKPIKLQKKEG